MDEVYLGRDDLAGVPFKDRYREEQVTATKPLHAIPDCHEDDGTPAAHPAWWRGHDAAVAKMKAIEADCGEPVSESWLSSAYETVAGEWISFQRDRLEGSFDIGGNIGVRWRDSRSNITVFGPYLTRGDFRAAVAAFGIGLKEKR